MKVAGKFLILLGSIFLLCSCHLVGNGNPGNYPYEPDSPIPDPHNGTFACESGSLSFNGDGKSIIVNLNSELAKLFELEEGEYTGTYVFLSGNLPPNGSIPIRYDAAHELEITIIDNEKPYTRIFDCGIASDDGKSSSVGIGVVTEERIPLLLNEDGKFYNVVFVKE